MDVGYNYSLCSTASSFSSALLFFVDRTNFCTSPFSKAHIIFHRTRGGRQETNGLKSYRNSALLGRLSNFFGNKYLNYGVLCPLGEDAECFWIASRNVNSEGDVCLAVRWMSTRYENPEEGYF